MNTTMRGVLLLAAAGSLWGLNGLYVQVLTNAGLGALSITFVRYLFALLVLAPALSAASAQAHRNILAMRPQHVACCVGMGLVSNALGGILSAHAIARIGVSTTTVLLYTAPVFGCLMSWRLYGERMNVQKACSIACNFLGVVLVVAAGGGLARGGLAADGVAAGLAYGFAYSLVAILSKPVAGVCHPLAVVYYGALTVVAALAVPALGTGELVCVLSPAPLVASLLYGGVSAVVANLLYQWGITCGVETSQVPVITSVEVAVSACVGMLLLGEPCSPAKLVGIALVLGSIVLMNAHAKPGEAHGVRFLPTADQLRLAYTSSSDLGAAVADLRRRREDAIVRS